MQKHCKCTGSKKNNTTKAQDVNNDKKKGIMNEYNKLWKRKMQEFFENDPNMQVNIFSIYVEDADKILDNCYSNALILEAIKDEIKIYKRLMEGDQNEITSLSPKCKNLWTMKNAKSRKRTIKDTYKKSIVII